MIPGHPASSGLVRPRPAGVGVPPDV